MLAPSPITANATAANESRGRIAVGTTCNAARIPAIAAAAGDRRSWRSAQRADPFASTLRAGEPGRELELGAGEQGARRAVGRGTGEQAAAGVADGDQAALHLGRLPV